MSPRTPSSGSSPSRPGRSSSIGNDMTSVGPGRSIHCTCRTSMAASSTRRRQRSAPGWTLISPMTYLLRATSSSSSSWKSVSLRTSTLTRPPSLPVGLPLRVVPPAVGVDDGADEAVAHDVLRGQHREVDVLDLGEDVADDPQAGPRPVREVDLGDVTGDDH